MRIDYWLNSYTIKMVKNISFITIIIMQRNSNEVQTYNKGSSRLLTSIEKNSGNLAFILRQ